jgi:1-acyl-sn-glycerol-3-phosphate acyltransferase
MSPMIVEGGEEIDWSKPHIFICNHQSILDIPVAFVALPCDLRFIAKRALAYVPFLGPYMWATGMIFVDRGAGEKARESVRQAGQRVKDGASVLAFAEGTRSKDGRIHEFKKGAFVVALESQVPIVPVAIDGADAVLPPGGLRVRPGVIRVKIGQPIPTAGLTYEDRDELIHRVREAIIAQHLAIGGRGAAEG